MEFNPVDYPGRGAPTYGALPPRSDMWTYGDLAKFVLFSIAAQVVSAIVALLAVVFLGSLVGEWLGIGNESVGGIVLVVATVATPILSLAYMYYVVAIKYRLPFWMALGFTSFRRYMYWFLLVGAAISVADGLVSELIGVPEDTPFAELLSDWSTYVMLGASAILIAPPLEEMLFRGFLYRPLERSWGPLGAIAISSFVFASIHGPQYAWSWKILFLVMLMGVYFGIARWKTGSLWPPILMHAGANAVSVVAFGLDRYFP